MPSVIAFENICYRFPGASEQVLSDVSLAFSPGEGACLAGANGSGKTTLALLLAGILTPTCGRVLVDGSPVPRVPTGLAAFGFQNPDDQMVASIVEKEVAFGLELRNQPMTQMESAISAALGSLGIGHLARRDIATLSGGEKQKTAMTALTVTQPRLLILDEPDSFMDAEGKIALEEALGALRRQFPDLVEIRITQDREAMARYERLIVLAGGRIRADKMPPDILSDEALLRENGLEIGLDHRSDQSVHVQTRQPHRDLTIKVTDLTFAYPNAEPLISNFELVWRGGEIIGVVGATGSGKTTLGLLLCGLLAPTGGTISFEGISNQLRPSSPVTMAVQQPERQFFLHTCAEEIAFGPKNLGKPITGQKIEQLLSQVGLDSSKYGKRDPLTLSVGEQRRLALAVLLALDRPFVIFDEPTAGLDSAGIAQFESIVCEIAQLGTGVMVISHDQGLIGRVATRKIVLGSK